MFLTRNSSMVAELKVPQNCVLETMKVTCTLACINKAAEQSSRLSKRVPLALLRSKNLVCGNKATLGLPGTRQTLKCCRKFRARPQGRGWEERGRQNLDFCQAVKWLCLEMLKDSLKGEGLRKLPGLKGALCWAGLEEMMNKSLCSDSSSFKIVT